MTNWVYRFQLSFSVLLIFQLQRCQSSSSICSVPLVMYTLLVRLCHYYPPKNSNSCSSYFILSCLLVSLVCLPAVPFLSLIFIPLLPFCLYFHFPHSSSQNLVILLSSCVVSFWCTILLSYIYLGIKGSCQSQL